MAILCVISARGGSKGVPGKNIRQLMGKPVIVWAIEKALAVSEITRVAVSTDSSAIADVARDAGAEVPFIRPAELAGPSIGKFQVWQHALEACEESYGEKYDTYIDLDCTNPMIDVEDIRASLMLFKKSNVDAVFTVSKARRNPYFNLVEPNEAGALKMSKSGSNAVLARQNAPPVYEHVAGVYVLAPSFLRAANHLLDGHAIGYEVEEEKSHDIDSECDFKIIEFLMKDKIN